MEKTEIMFEFDSNSENESLARTVVAAFLARLDPTLEELGDVKTAVSEAVTNAIIHGYDGQARGRLRYIAGLRKIPYGLKWRTKVLESVT